LAPETYPKPRLYALEAAGPRELEAPAGALNLHLLFDELPHGIYEALRTFQHDRFLGLAEHIERAEASIASAGLDYELDEAQLRAALHEIASAYPAQDSRLRFDVLRTAPAMLDTSSRVLIGIGPHDPPSDEVMSHGVRVGLNSRVQRSEPLVKSAGWVLERRPLEVEQDEYDVLLLDDEERLLECTSANFFAVRNGVIYTAGEHVLRGVTRCLLLQLAHELMLPIRQVPIVRDDIASLQEAFLTSSSRSIIPIVDIAGETVGDGKPGAITRKLIAAYDHMAQKNARWAIRPESFDPAE
jgi:branched-chain amino acid aminotransferase